LVTYRASVCFLARMTRRISTLIPVAWTLLGACAMLKPHSSSDDDAANKERGKANASADCTFDSKVDARCMEVRGYPSNEAPKYTRNEDENRAAYDCFQKLHLAEDTMKRDGSVDWYNYKQVADIHQQFANDPAGAECVKLADAATKGVFAYAMALETEKDKLGKTLEQTFARECKLKNVSLASSELGTFRVDLADHPKKPSSKVALEQTASPAYKILCNGDVVMTLPDGTSVTTAPHYASDVMSSKESCIHSCAHGADFADACMRVGQDENSPGCRSVCETHCANE
jgi:hypothetical protein